MLQNICEEIKFILFSSSPIASLLSWVKNEDIILIILKNNLQ